jgi:hypothetical protein
MLLAEFEIENNQTDSKVGKNYKKALLRPVTPVSSS